MNAAADGKLAAKSNNPFSAPGTDSAGSAPAEASQGAVDEGDIEAEGIESALVSLERVTAMLTLNCIQGVSPGMKVCSHCHALAIMWVQIANFSPQAAAAAADLRLLGLLRLACDVCDSVVSCRAKWNPVAVLIAQHVCKQLVIRSLLSECI